ncbi:ANP1/MMN9/VAN1 family protein [Aspergillus ibericus CBS 121593]|uniref:Mannan polymerase II complex ANP1 subunit n=1 Tax=Aspergillus ibericus CBS 121593 TaxID=1448316 RepID=A0A395HHQ7_9EURO|nr:mannan polymerase II complex ANP1 subunit [Aspergillus ibericus CBS 121593]RAL05774.1 mannan polymerase II complex ANP1 subunit [Aspergillus ibericus CBS 121593]
MLLPKGGVTWKSAKARLPPWRAVLFLVTRTRFLVSLAITGLVILLWRGISKSASEMQSFYCYGPSKSPMEMTINEMVEWSAHTQTPVLFNHHDPYEVNSSSIKTVDLNPIKSTTQAISNSERVLVLTPLRDASEHLVNYFNLLYKLTYPHDLIDLAFLVGDCSDDTLAVLTAELARIQDQVDEKIAFRSATIVQKDFGADTEMNVEDRHSFAAQGPRRKAIGKARNYLLYSALKPDHSWVYWRDVDIFDSPASIIEDFIAHDRDILVPNIWFHRYRDGVDVEGRFDYNSWIESDKGRRLRQTLDPDTVLAEGYKEYDTGRTYMVGMGDWRKNKDEEVELDGIGGVNILVKADVHRSGINFPAYAFENQAETEGFARMAKRAGYQVYGLPNYVVWHIDTEEKPGNLGDRKAY